MNFVYMNCDNIPAHQTYSLSVLTADSIESQNRKFSVSQINAHFHIPNHAGLEILIIETFIQNVKLLKQFQIFKQYVIKIVSCNLDNGLIMSVNSKRASNS